MTSQYDKREKVDQVYNLLLAGYTRFQIFKYVKNELRWDLAEITIDGYIKDAKEIMNKCAKEYECQQFELSLNRLDDLYRELKMREKYRDALEVLKERHKLLGLNAPEKKEIRINIDPSEMTDEELVKIINNE